jgi:hypothetical protein
MAGMQPAVAEFGRGATGHQQGFVQGQMLGAGRFHPFDGGHIKAVDDICVGKLRGKGLIGRQRLVAGSPKEAMDTGLEEVRADMEKIGPQMVRWLRGITQKKGLLT